MTLKVDEAEADEMVAKIQAAADDFRGRLTSLTTDAEIMDWTGAARDAYVSYINDVRSQFTQQIESQIDGSAETLKQTIKTLLDADSGAAQGLRH